MENFEAFASLCAKNLTAAHASAQTTVGLKIPHRKVCRFDSGPGHHARSAIARIAIGASLAQPLARTPTSKRFSPVPHQPARLSAPDALQLYIYTVLSHVVILRTRGSWKSRSELAGKPGALGVLDYRKADPNFWGRTMQARLFAIKGEERDILPVLQYARVLTIKEGGVLIDGFEISSRGMKSKAIKTRQTWWCITEHEPGYAVLDRWNPLSSSGFHVNDDDLVD